MSIQQSSSVRRGSGSAGAPESSRTVSTGPPRLTPLRELQLVEACRRGGPLAQEALTELLQAYQRRIYSVCCRIVRNPEDAADLTQDALLKMIEGLESYDGRSKLSTWAIRVAMNCCLSHLRRQKLRDHRSLDSQADTRAGITPGAGVGNRSAALSHGPEPSPAAGVEHMQQRALLIRAMDSLDPQMKAILVLRDLQDLDYQQLADVLEVPIGTVKSRLFRARAALRTAIESLGGP